MGEPTLLKIGLKVETEDLKTCITHIIRFSGEGKEQQLAWGFMRLESRPGMRVSTCEPGLTLFELSALQRREHLDYISLSRCGTEVEGEEVGLEIRLQSNIKNGVRLFIIAKSCFNNNP